MRFSVNGYKRGSKDFDEPFNVIPSNRITMKNVPFPILAMDNLGNIKVMVPNGEYTFTGNQVLEIPLRNNEVSRLSDGQLRQSIIEKAIEVGFLRGLSWQNLRIK
tara:strand:- start:1039 stop:1353 length:315 start_codon:yes stop_codon:yes gene_type:complete